MNVARIHEILRECTVQLRKGPAVRERDTGGVHVVEIYDMPREAEADVAERVDVHFVVVGVHRDRAKACREELIALLNDYPRLKDGPCYIEVGAELGDQGAALCLFGLGQVLGFWNVVTPALLGITGPLAEQMAGVGYVMTDGYRPSTSGEVAS